jgi:hypothetical protein
VRYGSPTMVRMTAGVQIPGARVRPEDREGRLMRPARPVLVHDEARRPVGTQIDEAPHGERAFQRR